MESSKQRLFIGVTGASGAVYARALFEKLKSLHRQIDTCNVAFTANALKVWEHEMGNQDYLQLPWQVYQPGDRFAPMTSGSSGFKTMIVCPCTMGTVARIAQGISDDLITRAADVILKERGKLVLLVREMPFSLIHLNNMKTLTEAGAVICPASPSFYSKPDGIEGLVETVIDRVLDLAGFENPHYRWQGGLGKA